MTRRKASIRLGEKYFLLKINKILIFIKSFLLSLLSLVSMTTMKMGMKQAVPT